MGKIFVVRINKFDLYSRLMYVHNIVYTRQTLLHEAHAMGVNNKKISTIPLRLMKGFFI